MNTTEHFTAIIVGSGFGGQCAAINLLKQGITHFVMLERRDFIGGTWKQNTYPGAAVDVQSPLYSLSFEPYDWSRMFAHQDELKRYTEYIFEKYKLLEKTRTNKTVKNATWLEDKQHWQVSVNENEQFTSQFLINASGPLSKPVVPNFVGKNSFQGAAFHTNNWDNDYDYSNKRVAIIGSGASAAQVIPSIADKVKHLHVFQRTPHWCLPRNDWTFKPWQRRLMRIGWFYRCVRIIIYWLLECRILGFKYNEFALNFLGTTPANKLLQEQVSDLELRKKLTPDYTIGCKRILVSNTLLRSLSRANVTLHDKTDGIKDIDSHGINTTQGEHVALDLIVYATGYDAADGVISYPVVGKNNTKLSDYWHDYPRGYLGTCVPHFPNFFIITGPNTGIGHTSALFAIESQLIYIMRCIETVRKNNAQTIEVTREAEQQYTQNIHKEMEKTVWHTGGCNSWYKSRSGKIVAMFPGFSFSFRRLCKRFKLAHHIIKKKTL